VYDQDNSTVAFLREPVQRVIHILGCLALAVGHAGPIANSVLSGALDMNSGVGFVVARRDGGVRDPAESIVAERGLVAVRIREIDSHEKSKLAESGPTW
jgi:hypothetical protein